MFGRSKCMLPRFMERLCEWHQICFISRHQIRRTSNWEFEVQISSTLQNTRRNNRYFIFILRNLTNINITISLKFILCRQLQIAKNLANTISWIPKTHHKGTMTMQQEQYKNERGKFEFKLFSFFFKENIECHFH